MGGGGGGGKAPKIEQAAPAAPAVEATKEPETADKTGGNADAQQAKARAAKLAQGIGQTVLSAGTVLGENATAAPGVTTKSTVLGG